MKLSGPFYSAVASGVAAGTASAAICCTAVAAIVVATLAAVAAAVVAAVLSADYYQAWEPPFLSLRAIGIYCIIKLESHYYI